MALVVYADFTSPWAYLASRRVDALVAAGIEVDWRAVESDPRLPVTGRRLDEHHSAELAAQVAAVTGLLLPGEQLPWVPPKVLCRTEAAVSGYAEAYGAGVGADVRRLLFQAYWLRGMDIGSPEVLRTLLAGPILRGYSQAWPLREHGYAVSVSGAPVTTEAWQRIRFWRAEWTALGVATTLASMDGGGAVHVGAAALRMLEKELLAAHADLDPALPDPARYPPTRVRPSMDWVSQVGGPWGYVCFSHATGRK